jgi:hypothetical protein
MCRTALRLLYIVKCMRVFGRPLGYFKVFVFAFKYHQHWMYTYLAHESSKLQRSFNSTHLAMPRPATSYCVTEFACLAES